jgi:hypothetical protein
MNTSRDSEKESAAYVYSEGSMKEENAVSATRNFKITFPGA